MVDVEDPIHALFIFNASPVLHILREVFLEQPDIRGHARFTSPGDLFKQIFQCWQMVKLLAKFVYDVLNHFESVPMYMG